MKRREFMKASAFATGLGIFGGGGLKTAMADPQPPAGSSEATDLTVYQYESRIWVRWHNQLLTVYRAGRDQKYPDFYPVAGPVTGLSLTTESAQPYPHHRSMFLGCDNVNGGNFWQDSNAEGQISSTNLRLGTCTDMSAEILDSCVWHKGDEEPIIEDERKFVVQVTNNSSYMINCTFKLTAKTDITINRTNHSLFAVRAAPDITPDGGGFLQSSEGKFGAEEIFGRPARWCTFYGHRKGLPENMIEGIAILPYPEPWKDVPWFVRDYGFMSPTPFYFIDKPYTIEEGQTLALNYRVVAYSGNPREADLDAIWKNYVNLGIGDNA